MSPFVVMALTGLAAGVLVPVTAIVAAKLGICDPFSLQIAGRKWTFSRKRHVVAANTSVRFEMMADHAYEGRCYASLSVIAVNFPS
jgi:hypothetical protein